MSTRRVVHRGENVDPNPGPPGVKPYEMEGRVEERTPLFTFEDVSDWIVEGDNAEGWLYRTEEQKLYREYCGKLVYVARGENPSLLVRPVEPIPIPDPWDSLNFWNYGNNWGWAPDPETPPVYVAAVLRDADGWEFEIPLGIMNYRYWFMTNGRLHEEEKARLVRPVSFVGFRFTNGTNREPRTIYLGPAYFFEEVLEPLSFEPWPEELPFPTREETILPTNKTDAFTNRVVQEGKTTRFLYEGDDVTLEYRYTPTDGTLGDIELLCGERRWRPLAGGWIQLNAAGGPVPPADERVVPTLRGSTLNGNVLEVSWQLDAGDVRAEVTYRFRILQKSLVIEIDVPGPVVERVALGRVEGLAEPKLFKVPYLTYGGNDPHILFSDGLFLFAQFDWYVSNASILDGAAETGSDWAIFNGPARYIPKTDKTRNPVFERLFLTASPDVHEVFPTVPNPPSPMREAQGHRLWRVKSGADHAAEVAEATRFRRYGCEHVTIRYHEDTWRDAGESFTFRLEAAPGRGGDEALRRFVASVKELGWRVGLYTNYTDYAPVNKMWNEDWVNRLPNGDWQREWMRCYAPKPMRAVEVEAKNAPIIYEKFRPNHSYCDVHTAVTPFSRVDYDARVPGAGTFRRTFECFGRILYNEKFAYHGPVYSEGRNHWWYAGLTDGNYAQIISPSPPSEPLFVDFDLLKLHPLQMDAGMGAPGMFFGRGEANLDQFIATTIAYGHIGFLEWASFEGALKIYYMIQRLQERYAMVPVARIEYDDGGELVDTSQALATDAYLRNRVHVVYENGTEVFVNGNTEPWTVRLGDQEYTLPEWGYVALADDRIVISALLPIDGKQGPTRRMDAAYAPGQLYADSRGGFAVLGPLAVEGSGALKMEGGRWWAIPTTTFADFAFPPDAIGAEPDAAIDVTAVRHDGSEIGGVETRWSRGVFHILPSEATNDGANAMKYRIDVRGRRELERLASERFLVRSGETISVTIAPRFMPEKVTWEVDRNVRNADLEVQGDTLRVAVPQDFDAEAHLWLRVDGGGRTEWLDFLVDG